LNIEELIRLIREEGPLGIFLVCLFALPFTVTQWLSLFEAAGTKFAVTLLVITLAPLILFIILFFGRGYQSSEAIARVKILTYLETKNYRLVSFERIRQSIDNAYSDEFLNKVIAKYDNTFRHATLKGGKIGLARLNEEEEA